MRLRLACSFVHVALLLVLAAPACGGDETELIVELRTDYRPGINFAFVRTEWSSTAYDARAGVEETPVIQTTAALEGVRIASFRGLPIGNIYLRVRLIDAEGEMVAERKVLVTFGGHLGVTVPILSSCAGVACDDGETCIDAVCGDPRCTPSTPELCTAGCTTDDECQSRVSCGEPRCVESLCFVYGSDETCGTAMACDPIAGCVPTGVGSSDGGFVVADGSVADGAVATDGGGPGPVETACLDGADNDGDGATDCEDSDCVGAGCNDGNFCNGVDTCGADGTCSGHAGDPCPAPTVCDASTTSCTGCGTDDSACPADEMVCDACTYGTTCAASGSASCTLTSYACVDNECMASSGPSSMPCTRASRDGVSCGATMDGVCGWGSTCAETGGTQEQMEQQCGSGICGIVLTTVACPNRDTDGMSCAGCGGAACRCVTGSCTNVGGPQVINARFIMAPSSGPQLQIRCGVSGASCTAGATSPCNIMCDTGQTVFATCDTMFTGMRHIPVMTSGGHMSTTCPGTVPGTPAMYSCSSVVGIASVTISCLAE